MQLNHCTRLSVIFKQEKGRSQFPCLRRIPVCRLHADRCDGGMIELIFAGIAALKRYIGWDTERLVSNIYQKIIHLQKIVRIGYDPKRILIRRRLINLLSLLLLLSRHIGR
jgi:hypothetical protein